MVLYLGAFVDLAYLILIPSLHYTSFIHYGHEDYRSLGVPRAARSMVYRTYWAYSGIAFAFAVYQLRIGFFTPGATYSDYPWVFYSNLLLIPHIEALKRAYSAFRAPFRRFTVDLSSLPGMEKYSGYKILLPNGNIIDKNRRFVPVTLFGHFIPDDDPIITKSKLRSSAFSSIRPLPEGRLLVVASPHPRPYEVLYCAVSRYFTVDYDYVLSVYDGQTYEVEPMRIIQRRGHLLCYGPAERSTMEFVGAALDITEPELPDEGVSPQTRQDMEALASILNDKERGIGRLSPGLRWAVPRYPGPVLRIEHALVPLSHEQSKGHPYERPLYASGMDPGTVEEEVARFLEELARRDAAVRAKRDAAAADLAERTAAYNAAVAIRDAALATAKAARAAYDAAVLDWSAEDAERDAAWAAVMQAETWLAAAEAGAEEAGGRAASLEAELGHCRAQCERLMILMHKRRQELEGRETEAQLSAALDDAFESLEGLSCYAAETNWPMSAVLAKRDAAAAQLAERTAAYDAAVAERGAAAEATRAAAEQAAARLVAAEAGGRAASLEAELGPCRAQCERLMIRLQKRLQEPEKPQSAGAGTSPHLRASPPPSRGHPPQARPALDRACTIGWPRWRPGCGRWRGRSTPPHASTPASPAT